MPARFDLAMQDDTLASLRAPFERSAGEFRLGQARPSFLGS